MLNITEKDYNELVDFFKVALHNVEQLSKENEKLKKEASELKKQASGNSVSVFSEDRIKQLKTHLDKNTPFSKEATTKVCNQLLKNPEIAIDLIVNLTKSSNYQDDGRTFGNYSNSTQEDPWVEALRPSNR